MSGRGRGRDGGRGGRGRGRGRWAGRGSAFGGRRGGRGGRGGRSNYQRQMRGRVEGGRSSGRSIGSSTWMLERRDKGNKLDATMGFSRLESGAPRIGYIMNMLATTVTTDDGVELAALDLYMLQQDGATFKATITHAPYFYIATKPRLIKEVATFLERRFEGLVASVERKDMEDLDMDDHLSGRLRAFLKLSFRNVSELMEVRRDLLPAVKRNHTRANVAAAYEDVHDDTRAPADLMEAIIDMREYDVPYYTRVSIDRDVRVGSWYRVSPKQGHVVLERLEDMVVKASPRVLAFDIECTKSPLKFPDARIDQIYMISYMLDNQGYLIINRQIVSEDIEDFEYTPKPEFKGPFHVFNVENEERLIRRFFDHVLEVKPQIFVTYNGDFFDWPFIDERASQYGMDMSAELGVYVTRDGEYRGRTAVHMDCIYWVRRDSYLPAGSHGLKAVTKYKLGYDPVEIDPEDMLRFAHERPKYMSSYSVSDAVATYYLYMKYVHNFIFSLCTIIPMQSEDVLRKGSGTLCEMLLQVEAFKGNIVCPNKQVEERLRFIEGHLVDTETYIGGHVECLESGVFRADIPSKFRLVPSALQELIDKIDRALTFSLEVENGVERMDVLNYDEVRNEIVAKLENLRDVPLREETPVIYHLDVAAMYPNIILSNRLQPCAIVDQKTCASCSFNDEANDCKRRMEWMWRGEYHPLSKPEYNTIKAQLEYEPVDDEDAPSGRFQDLPLSKQADAITARVKTYCQKVYKRVKDITVKKRVATVCQRENPFYVNTVRAFRDRRYEYKRATKDWVKKLIAAERGGDKLAAIRAKDLVVLYDSLQLAHKCILNSFYGYVMRKGARWHSMEMAGVVTYTGANLIKQARVLVEQIGRPLELDTDGIWCILPGSFPEDFTFKLRNGKKVTISYPCIMLNADVHDNYTNHQYQDLADKEARTFNKKSECSIYFEVDGPYRCMVLPASLEEGKLLKKRYAVFEFDGSLAELKGFELKRRGELKIIKIFQQQVFHYFLKGNDLPTCYEAVGEVANYWLDILFTQGEDLEDDELLELISENKSMSRTLEEYGTQKSTSITTAKRLAELLGQDMVKDKGLNCKMVIASKPEGAPVTERAIPTAIFAMEEAVQRYYLRRWCKDPSMSDFDIRGIVDWNYYIVRLGSAIQKIITIPAAIQRVENPVERIAHPDWLQKLVRAENDPFRQQTITNMFTKRQRITDASGSGCGSGSGSGAGMVDIEDSFGADSGSRGHRPALVHMHKRVRGGSTSGDGVEESKGAAAGGSGDGDGDDEADEDVDLEDGLEGWLAVRKQQWRVNRRKKAERRVRQAHARAIGASQGRRLNIFREMSASASQGYWQIVELRETQAPGVFKCWVFTGQGVLQCLNLTVPRVVYVNCLRRDANFEAWGYKRVTRLLPRGHPSQHLYELCTSEEDFQRKSKALREARAGANVEGIYETQTPLLTRALLKLGCVAQVGEDRRQRALAGDMRASSVDFNLKDLDWLSTTTHSYLQPDSAAFKRMFIYHSSSNTRGILACFMIEETNAAVAQLVAKRMREAVDHAPADASAQDITQRVNAAAHVTGGVDVGVTARARVWLINPFVRDRGVPKFAPIFAQVNTVTDNTCTFTPRVVRNAADAWTNLGSHLRRYQAGRSAPTVVIVQSTLSKSALLHLVPSLDAFPVVMMPGHPGDNRYPAMGWKQMVAQAVVVRYLGMHAWWQERLSCCRYSHVPVGNLGDDFESSMADIFFARTLQHNKHVLWMSRTHQADTGSGEDLPMLMLSSNLGSVGKPSLVGAGEPMNPSVCRPGAYRRVCIELELSHLAVSTVIMSHHLDEIEGGGGLSSLPDQGMDNFTTGAPAGAAGLLPTSLDATTACASAFKMLKLLVSNWMKDVTNHSNMYADMLLTKFYRWLCSPASDLYDPLLHRMVHKMMCKAFLQLVAELRKLGCTIVYATLDRIILSTNKDTLESARSYCDYIVETVRSRPLFSWISLEPKVYWEQLLFMDEANNAGVLMHGTPGLADAEEAADLQEAAAAAAEAARGGQASGDYDSDSSSGNSADSSSPARARRRAAKQRQRQQRKVDDEVKAAIAAKYGTLSDSDEEGAAQAGDADGGGAGDRARPTSPVLPSDLESSGSSDMSDDDDDILEYDSDASGSGVSVASGSDDAGAGVGSGSDDDDVGPVRGRRDRKRALAAKAKARERAEQRAAAKARREAKKLARREARRARREAAKAKREADMDALQPGLGKSVAARGGRLGQRAMSRVMSNWNIAEYLPGEVGQLLQVVAAEFVAKPVDMRAALRREHDEALAARVGSQAITASQMVTGGGAAVGGAAAREAELKAEDKFVKFFVSDTLTRRMMQRYVPRINSLGIGPADFPTLPGSHLTMSSPALEFIKMVTHVLALDTTVATEVSRLKSNLLRLVGVHDFAVEAQFVNPCLSYVLSDVICSHCGWGRDVDLCRDRHVSGHALDDNLEWLCTHCGTPYGRDAIEQRLVGIVERASTAYQLQDLVCTKCSAVKADTMSQYCECSGLYRTEYSPKEFAHSLLPFRSIASYYRFEWLAETVAHTLGERATA